MSLSVLFAYCGALLLAAAIPGPGMTSVIARALGSSFAATFPMALGLILGDLIYLTAVVLGLAVVAQTFGTAFMVIKYLGAAYLAWMAYKIWTAGITISDMHEEKQTSSVLTFLSGLFITLGNPKPMLFYIALVPSIVDIQHMTFADYGILVVATTLVLLAVLIPYIALATRIRQLMKQPKPLQILNRIAAGFLAGSAAFIAFRAG